MTDAPAPVYEFVWPDRVVIGTVGLPGSRTFYLQARTGPRIVSVALEKEQAALLAQKVDEILDRLREVEGNRWSVPTSTPVEPSTTTRSTPSRSSSAPAPSASAGTRPRPS